MAATDTQLAAPAVFEEDKPSEEPKTAAPAPSEPEGEAPAEDREPAGRGPRLESQSASPVFLVVLAGALLLVVLVVAMWSVSPLLALLLAGGALLVGGIAVAVWLARRRRKGRGAGAGRGGPRPAGAGRPGGRGGRLWPFGKGRPGGKGGPFGKGRPGGKGGRLWPFGKGKPGGKGKGSRLWPFGRGKSGPGARKSGGGGKGGGLWPFGRGKSSPGGRKSGGGGKGGGLWPFGKSKNRQGGKGSPGGKSGGLWPFGRKGPGKGRDGRNGKDGKNAKGDGKSRSGRVLGWVRRAWRGPDLDEMFPPVQPEPEEPPPYARQEPGGPREASVIDVDPRDISGGSRGPAAGPKPPPQHEPRAWSRPHGGRPRPGLGSTSPAGSRREAGGFNSEFASTNTSRDGWQERGAPGMSAPTISLEDLELVNQYLASVDPTSNARTAETLRSAADSADRDADAFEDSAEKLRISAERFGEIDPDEAEALLQQAQQRDQEAEKRRGIAKMARSQAEDFEAA